MKTVLAVSGGDLTQLLQEPWFLKTIAWSLLFALALILTRGARRVARELERRKALADYVRGLDEFLRGDFHEAIATLERVLERDPENVEARIALGDCYREIGDPAEAKKHHHHVHKVFGNELARNFLSLGRDELALGHYDRAVEAFEQSLKLSADEPDALWALALAYSEGGESAAAADAVRRIHPDGPRPDMAPDEKRRAARLLSDAGAALLADGHVENAIRFYTEALAFLPSDLRARAGLLRAAHALGDESRAHELVREHIAQLQELTQQETVLFEPRRSAPPVERDEAPADASYLPARVEDLGGLVTAIEAKTARYRCSTCGTLCREHAVVCPRCDTVGTIEPLRALAEAYGMPLRDCQDAADEIEESAGFIQSLARKAAIGDEAALERLVAMGTNTLYDVFAALPALEARRYLGARMAALGPEAGREVRACHSARAGNAKVVRPHDEFAVGFFLALGEDGAAGLTVLGPTRDAAIAGAMVDPRLDTALRDRAQDMLSEKGVEVLVPIVETIAAEGDGDGIRRAAEIAVAHGDAAVDALERRYLQAKLLGRLLGARTGRRRVAADVLARTGLPSAVDALGRAAAREKDPVLRTHYAAAKTRAEQGADA